MHSKLKRNGSGGERMVTRQMAAAERDSRSPLHLPEMLEYVLGFLPVEVLKNCRLVNKFWKETALKPMKKKCRFLPALREERSMESFLQCFSVDPGSGLLSEFRDDIPCTRFEMFTTIINEESSERDKSIVANFLQAISPWATEITLNEGKDIGVLLDGIEELTFPSLKCIVFADTTFAIGVETHCCVFSPWMSVFIQNSPQLEKLNFRARRGERDPRLMSFFQVLKDKQSLSIKDLIIDTTIEDNDLISLSESGLQLKSLVLRISNLPKVSIGFVWQLLKSQSDSLENLSIENWRGAVDEDVAFPIMKSLTSLTIKGRCPGLVNYAEQMPSLKRVVLEMVDRDWLACLSGKLKPAPGVKELRCSWNCPIALTIREAVRIFPNITKLKIPVENHSVSIVYDSLPNLEELTLLTPSVHARPIDKLLTGLTEQGCQNATQTLRDWTPDFDDSEIQIGINHSPVSVLTKLKLLRLWNFRDRRISEVSLCLALMKMPSLRILDLCVRRMTPDEWIPSTVLNEFRKNRLILWKLDRNAQIATRGARNR